jgi:hypothetical protein
MKSDRLVFSLRDRAGYVAGLPTSGRLTDLPGETVSLNLERSSVINAGLASLSHLKRLRCLDLDGTDITDEGLVSLSELPTLEELWLESTQVTDAGLHHLAACKNLRFLSVVYTSVTSVGITRLREALPGLEVSA